MTTKIVVVICCCCVLFACQDVGKCKESIYNKKSYPTINCTHSEHQLIERPKHWYCRCLKGWSGPNAPAKKKTTPEKKPVVKKRKPKKPAQSPPADYSWLDTKY